VSFISEHTAPDAPLSRATRAYFAEVAVQKARDDARDALEAGENAISLALDIAIRDGDTDAEAACLKAMHSAAALLCGAAS